jgi:predicted pyridoxine 5'-phosphate oxidase superfamily flavin-nucleotide-binding protein
VSGARDDDSPFHAGELAVQARLGVRARAEQVGLYGVRDFMPEQHRAFFAALPYVFVGSVDPRGRPWASMLVGAPGFLQSPDAQQLDVSAALLPGDPLAEALKLHAPLGLLGIQLETRRRNRMNGRVVALSDAGFSLRVDQSFGNCPKYITARAPLVRGAADEEETRAPTPESVSLSADAVALIRRVDTCFIASASSAQADLADAREGVDVSHRGGTPGFVRVDTRPKGSLLTMPDFSGNDMFNTLGNLTRYPRAGLLFVDFESGDLLLVTCTTELVFSGPEVESFAGARRLLRFHVEAGLLYRAALPFVWTPAEPSPQHDKMGSWPR